jgi:glycosyltransferase involved in cell wall biosynthesis
MRPFFSIIVPYHNSTETIGPLLDSIKASKDVPPFEVIVVDDGSREGARMADLGAKFLKKYRFPVRVIAFAKNRGPAVARNTGVAHAKGKFVLFLDGDIRLFTDALHNLWQIYAEDPDIVAVTGVWAKEQKTDKFFPNFKALRDWSYWINERDAQGYYYLFSTRIASIKRAVFLRLKGFDEKYAGPLVEDIEFTYRIARRYAVIFAPNVRVHHEFEDFWPIAKKYFWRTYYWTKLYQRRKKFDPVATTWKEATSSLSGIGWVGLAVLAGILVLLTGTEGFEWLAVWRIPAYVAAVSAAFLLVHLVLVRKFLGFVYREKGFVFAVRSFFVGLVLYAFITAGAVWGRIR